MTRESSTPMTIAEEYTSRAKKENVMNRVMGIAPIGVLILLIIVFRILCGRDFLGSSNITNILNQLAVPLCVAIGLTWVIMIGSIDLSINGVVGMAGCLAGVFVSNSAFDYNFGVLGILIALASGVAAGFAIGLIHVKLRVPSFMASLAVMYICTGLGRISYYSKIVKLTDPFLKSLGVTSFIGIPMLTWIALALLGVSYLIQEYTAFGRHVYAVGTNEAVPRSVGINVDWVKIRVFMIGGFMSAAAGVIGMIRLGLGQIQLGNNKMFPAQAAVVIGGTALTGGKGGVHRTLIGVLIMTVLENGLTYLGVSAYIRDGVQGIIILVCVIITSVRGKTVIAK